MKAIVVVDLPESVDADNYVRANIHSDLNIFRVVPVEVDQIVVDSFLNLKRDRDLRTIRDALTECVEALVDASVERQLAAADRAQFVLDNTHE